MRLTRTTKAPLFALWLVATATVANAAPITYTGTPHGAIGSGGNNDVSQSIVVADAGALTGVEVHLTLGTAHTYVGDLFITLSNGTTTADIMVRPGSVNFSLGFGWDFGGPYTFADGGASIWAQNGGQYSDNFLVPAGTYAASTAGGTLVSLNALFGGQNRAGSWTLRIRDQFSGDSGVVTAWGLTLTTADQVPEPTGLSLLALGAGAAAFRRRRSH